MSKRLLTLMTLMLLLAVASFTQAQETGTPAGLFLTEAQINTDLRIPNSAARQISNLEVDVKEDGLRVSFQMTVTRDGTSNTLNIIAILIGLFDQPRVSAIQLENTLISNYVVSPTLRREVTSLILSSWNAYEANVLASLPVQPAPTDQIIMRDGGICNPRWGC